jgi:hypothetical protein
VVFSVSFTGLLFAQVSVGKPDGAARGIEAVLMQKEVLGLWRLFAVSG